MRTESAYPDRVIEWMFAVMMASWGLFLLLPMPTFENPQYAVLAAIAPEQVWGLFSLAIAIVRMVALWITRLDATCSTLIIDKIGLSRQKPVHRSGTQLMRRLMPGITRRKDSTKLLFNVRVPQDVLKVAKGKRLLIDLPAHGGEPEIVAAIKIAGWVKFSLRTTNPTTANLRSAAANAALETYWNNLRNGTTNLSHKQMIALSGEIYRELVKSHEDNPGAASNWTVVKGWGRAVSEGRVTSSPQLKLNPDMKSEVEIAEKVFGYDLTSGINRQNTGNPDLGMESRYGLVTNTILMKNALHVDGIVRTQLIRQVHSAVQDACLRLKQNASGDYSPDKSILRFPSFEITKPGISFAELYEKWQNERQPSVSTLRSTNAIVRSLGSFVGNVSIAEISSVKYVAWKDSLLTDGKLTTQTISTNYIAMTKAIFEFAKENKLIDKNPAEGVRVKSKGRLRMLPYSDEEIATILKMTENLGNPARRWLPLLAAATGARIGELAQLWKENIQLSGNQYYIKIRAAPDFGSIKNIGSERQIPMHPILVEKGFPDFVNKCPDSPLFYVGRTSKGQTHRSKAITDKLGAWIRQQGFGDKRKSPNHAIRHWWKNATRHAGISVPAINFLQGHSTPGAAAIYTHFSDEELTIEIAKLKIPGF